MYRRLYCFSVKCREEKIAGAHDVEPDDDRASETLPYYPDAV
jgi:hypothetical protein